MLDWFFPQTIEKRKSIYGQEIKVVRSFGKISITVGGIEQSGPMVTDIWSKVLKGKTLNKVLVLGFGSGSIANYLKKTNPGIYIYGVEIDSAMVELGKKYLDLTEAQVEIGDAGIYVKKTKEKFDLILVDLYCGNKFPPVFGQDSFLIFCAKMLSPRGTIVFNRLRLTRKTDLVPFKKKLVTIFKNVGETKTEFNTFFTANVAH